MAFRPSVGEAKLHSEDYRALLTRLSATKRGRHPKSLPILFDEITELESREMLTLTDLQTIMDFKLMRGTFRPGLRQKIARNDPSFVEKVTQQAFREDSGKALDTLCTLHGVGPATAALILSIQHPGSICPMSDEALLQFWPKPRYDRRTFLSLQENVKTMLEGSDMTPLEWERAIWTQKMREKLCPNASKSRLSPAGSKRDLGGQPPEPVPKRKKPT